GRTTVKSWGTGDEEVRTRVREPGSGRPVRVPQPDNLDVSRGCFVPRATAQVGGDLFLRPRAANADWYGADRRRRDLHRHRWPGRGRPGIVPGTTSHCYVCRPDHSEIDLPHHIANDIPPHREPVAVPLLRLSVAERVRCDPTGTTAVATCPSRAALPDTFFCL